MGELPLSYLKSGLLKVWLTLLYFFLKGFRTLISWNSGILIPEVEEIPEFEAFI